MQGSNLSPLPAIVNYDIMRMHMSNYVYSLW